MERNVKAHRGVVRVRVMGVVAGGCHQLLVAHARPRASRPHRPRLYIRRAYFLFAHLFWFRFPIRVGSILYVG